MNSLTPSGSPPLKQVHPMAYDEPGKRQKSLDIAGRYSDYDDSSLQEFLTKYPDTTHVNVRCTRFGLSAFRALNPNIVQTLKIALCQEITADVIAPFLSAAKNIVSLDLDKEQCNRNVLIALVQMKPTLKELKLEGIPPEEKVLLKQLLLQSSALTSLELNDCHWLNDTDLKEIIQWCPHLQTLSLFRSSVGDDGCAYLAASSLPLQSLNLPACKRISQKGLNALMSSQTILGCHKLDVSGPSGATLPQFCSAVRADLPQLTTLLISALHLEPSVEDDDDVLPVYDASHFLSMLKRFPNLQYLNTIGIEGADANLIHQIVEVVPTLKTLWISTGIIWDDPDFPVKFSQSHPHIQLNYSS